MRHKTIAASLVLAGVVAATSLPGQTLPQPGAQIVVNETTQGPQSSPSLAFGPAGYLAAWTGQDGGQHPQIFGRLLNPAGVPRGDEFPISSGVSSATSSPRVAASAGGFAVIWIDQGGSGNTLIFTADSATGTHGRLFDSSWNPLTADLLFQAPAGPVVQYQPAAGVDAAGGFLALWTAGPSLGDGNDYGVIGRPLVGTACLPGSETLCLGPAGRFQARVAWRNPNTGETGTGHTLPLTHDTGAFWFFGDQNLELMVKVLDGTTVNLHYWVYGGSLSNVEYTLTVTDTLTGVERTYHNPAGQFASLADVGAFPPGLSAEATGTAARPTTAQADPLVGCLAVAADPTSLCLASGHFTVGVEFTDPRSGLAGTATAVPLTSDTGAFWFFGETNLELMVKVLDGRTVNGKYWVFYGALSDVDYTITVTRVETGEAKTYHNPRGTLASHADTQAF